MSSSRLSLYTPSATLLKTTSQIALGKVTFELTQGDHLTIQTDTTQVANTHYAEPQLNSSASKKTLPNVTAVVQSLLTLKTHNIKSSSPTRDDHHHQQCDPHHHTHDDHVEPNLYSVVVHHHQNSSTNIYIRLGCGDEQIIVAILLYHSIIRSGENDCQNKK